MEHAKANPRRVRRSCRSGILHRSDGQALIETALVILLLAAFFFAVIEFGRAFMVSNAVTNAARIGARLAAIAQAPANRDPNGIIDGAYISTIEDEVRAEVAAIDPTLAAAMAVQVNQINGPPPMVEVRITGNLPAIFNYLNTSSFDIDRSVTFPDQGRRIN